MPLNDAELRFRATLEDDTTPQLDKLQRKLEAMGASPAEIRMLLSAQDQATPHIEKVRKQLNDLPKEQLINIKAASEGARQHLQAVKQEFKEPIEVPIHFVDNLDEVGQKLFTLKSRFIVPTTGLIPGANLLYGVGAGAGILGAITGVTSYLKQSIDVNSELEQQNAQLTQALKDSGAATAELARISRISASSQFSRSDLAQADIISRQFNLPSFRGESKYLPSGVLPIAQNLAAAGQTSVTQSTDAIARATQGYFRGLLPYGISIRQEDFGQGGRFSGKSYEQALEIASKRFSGAAEAQANTFQGLIQRFKNVFEEKFITPLASFAFPGIKSLLGGALGGIAGGSFQQTVGNTMAKLQDDLTKAWLTLQRGKIYFDTNLKQPLEEITGEIVKLGGQFAKFFGGTFVVVLGTLGKALLAIAEPVTKIITTLSKPIGPLPGLIQTYAIFKALSVIGFGNIGTGLVAPMKDLAGLHPLAFVADLAKIPGILAKIAIFFIAKGFLDAHMATKALNNEFPTLHKNMADINWQIDKMADGLGISATKMKELVAASADQLKNSGLTDQQKLDLSEHIGKAGGQLHLALGVDATSAGIMIAKAVAASKDYSASNVAKFENELGGATAAAKELGYSFSSLQRIMAQYASVAGPAGLGGIHGAAALTGLQAGADALQKRGSVNNANELVNSILSTYGNPSNEDLKRLGPDLSQYYSFTNNRKAIGSFTFQTDLLREQSRTADRSNRLAASAIRKLAPSVDIPSVPNPLQAIQPASSITGLRGATDKANETGRQLQDASKLLGNANEEAQKLQSSISKLDERTQEYGQAQQRVNLQLEAFQHGMLGTQRQIEDISVGLQEFQLKAVTPVQRALERVGQAIAENSQRQSNAQYHQSEFTQGLLDGEQAALNQAHAMEQYSKQLQMIQLQYQQIGAQVGTNVYERGYSSRVAPLQGLNLAYQQQQLQRKQQIESLKYDTTYGEQHYQIQQAARTEFQRTEHSFKSVMDAVKKTVPIIDETNRASHNLGNTQFNMSTHMFHLNQHMEDEQNKIAGLQLKLAKLNSSGEFRKLQDEQHNLQRQTEFTSLAQQRLQTKLGVYQNILDPFKGHVSDLRKLLAGLRADLEGGPFAQAKKSLEVAFKAHIIDGPKFAELWSKLSDAQDADKKARQERAWMHSRESWEKVIANGVKGIFTGSTERQVVEGFQHGLRHPPHLPLGLQHVTDPIRHMLGWGPLGTAAAIATTGYVGISTARSLLGATRYGLTRGGGRALQHLLPETHVASFLDRRRLNFMDTQEAIGHRIQRATKRMEETTPGTPEHEKAHAKILRDEAARRRIEENAGKADVVRAADKRAGELREAITGPWKWFRNFHEKTYNAVITTAFVAGAAAINPALAPVGLLAGRRVSRRLAEERTLRRDLGAGLSGAEAVAKLLRHPVDTLKKTASDEMKAAKEQHQASKEQRDAAKEHKKVIDKQGRITDKEGEHVHEHGDIIHEHGVHIGKFGKFVSAFGVAAAAIATFGGWIKNHIPGLPHDRPRVPGHGAAVHPNEGGHPETAMIRNERGMMVPNPLHAVAVTKERASFLRRLGRLPGHLPNAFFGVQNFGGELAGQPGALAYAGGSVLNQLTKAVSARMEHGSVPEALKRTAAERVGKSVEEVGAKDIAKTILKRVGATGLGIAGGAVTAPIDAYYAFTLWESLTHSNAPPKHQAYRNPTDQFRFGQTNRNPAAEYTAAQMRAGLPNNISDSEGRILRSSLAPVLAQNEWIAAHPDMDPDQYKAAYKKLQDLQDVYNRQFKDATKSQGDDTQKMIQDASDKLTKTNQDANKQRLSDLTDYHKKQSQITDQGYTTVYNKTDDWLTKLRHRINQTAKGLGVTLGSSDSAPDASQPGGGTRRFAHGGFPAQHVIPGRKDGKGHLIRVGEEDDELIIPMAPHRRQRAKSLVRQAAGMLGFADGGYVNPFRHANYLPSRVDMGVDYSGSGPVEAIGDAKVLYSQAAPGWDSGNWISYQLTSGAKKNAIVFVAEGIRNMIPGGSRVRAGQRIADMYRNIETGWATSSPQQALAAALGQQNKAGDPGEFPTAAGVDFNRFLVSLGATSGLVAGKARGSFRDVASTIGSLSAATGDGGMGGLPPITDLVPRSLLGSGVAGALAFKSLQRLKSLYNRALGPQGDVGGYKYIKSLSNINHVFPQHTRNDESGRARLAPGLVKRLAEIVGLPGDMFMKIAHGESNFFPGVVSYDGGWGLWQHTPRTWGAEGISKLNSLGGLHEMLNPIKNAKMAKYLFDHAPSKVPNTKGFPWYGTEFLKSYEAGIDRIPHDSIVKVHKNETILPRAVAAAYRAARGGAGTGGMQAPDEDTPKKKRTREHIESIHDLIKKIHTIMDDAKNKKGKKGATLAEQLNAQLRARYQKQDSKIGSLDKWRHRLGKEGDESAGEDTGAGIASMQTALTTMLKVSPALQKAQKEVAAAQREVAKAAIPLRRAMVALKPVDRHKLDVARERLLHKQTTDHGKQLHKDRQHYTAIRKAVEKHSHLTQKQVHKLNTADDHYIKARGHLQTATRHLTSVRDKVVDKFRKEEKAKGVSPALIKQAINSVLKAMHLTNANISAQNDKNRVMHTNHHKQTISQSASHHKVATAHASALSKHVSAVSSAVTDEGHKARQISDAARKDTSDLKTTTHKADDKRTKAEIAADLREKNFQAQALKHLKSILEKDTSVNIVNNITGHVDVSEEVTVGGVRRSK